MSTMHDLDPRLRQLAERALAGIAVPDGPRRVAGRPASGVVVLAVAAAVVVLAALGTARFLSELRDAGSVAATPPAGPSATDRRDVPVPVAHRNTRFGYDLVLPASFRRSEAETPLVTLWPRRPELDTREIFTARSPEQERPFAGAPVLPWDLIVEVYERKGATTETWAAWLGCPIGQPPPGTSPCTYEHTTLAGTPALVATIGDPLPGKMYLVDRGDRLLVLRYGLGTDSNRPQGVTAETLERIVHSLGLVDPAPLASAAPRVMAAADVWAHLRATLPSAPVAEPRWLPDTIDRQHVTLSGLVADASDPRYVVTYGSARGTIVLALGPADEIAGSGYGTQVRGQSATLTFATALFSDPSTPAPRRLRWRESGNTLSISSETFSGDDVLHIAWSLDTHGAPLRSFTRSADGACAKAGGAPMDTVRAYVRLLGSGTRDELADCWADEVLGSPNTQPIDPTASLPTLPATTLDDIRIVGGLGGRTVVSASWTFAADPGSAWGPRPTRFFIVAPEAGRWRITEIGSAPMGPPP